MGCGDQGEGAGVGEQRFFVCNVVDKLCDRKVQAVATTQPLVFEAVGAPGRVVIGEYGEAGDGAVVSVKDAPLVLGL